MKYKGCRPAPVSEIESKRKLRFLNNWQTRKLTLTAVNQIRFSFVAQVKQT